MKELILYISFALGLISTTSPASAEISNLNPADAVTGVGSNLFLQVFKLITIQKPPNYNRAIELCNEVLQEQQDRADAHAMLGKIFHKRWQAEGKGEDEQLAVSHWRKAVQMDTNNVDAHNDLASYFLGQMELVQADDEIKKVLSIDPSNQRAKNSEAVRLRLADLSKKKRDEAIATVGDDARSVLAAKIGKLSQEAALKPAEVGPKEALAESLWLLSANGLEKPSAWQAVGVWLAVLELDADNIDVLLALGRAYLEFKDRDNATKYYERAALIDQERTLAELTTLESRQDEVQSRITAMLSEAGVDGKKEIKNQTASAGSVKTLQLIRDIKFVITNKPQASLR